MRCIAVVVTILLAFAPASVLAQSSATESSPQGPRTGESQGSAADRDEIRRLRREVEDLTRQLEALSSGENRQDSSGDLAGTWNGAVSCRNRHYAVVLNISEQAGSIGKGDWSFTGSGSGSDTATLTPMISEGAVNRYVLVTAKSNTYDYDVTIDGNRMSGMSTRDRCQIFMERG